MGYIGPKWAITNRDCTYGSFVYFDFNNNFVDNKRFKLPKGHYFYAEGTYQYISRRKILNTVRKVKVISKNIEQD